LHYFVLVFSGSDLLAVAGRDKDATWRTLGKLCRERDWPRQRLLSELRNGLRYRTYPEGYVIDWHDPRVQRELNIEASEITIGCGERVLEGGGKIAFITGLEGGVTLGIEVLPPTDAEVPAPSATSPETASRKPVQWARATTRRLRAESKIPEGVKKAQLARVLETESQKAVKTGQLSHSLKASYLENVLVPWGIFPLSSFE
jgi:hypothetical protein